jgi:hypothetical protein
MRLHQLFAKSTFVQMEAVAADAPHVDALIAHFRNAAHLDLLAFYKAPPGAMEALVAEARAWCRACGFPGERSVRRAALLYLYLGYDFHNDPRYRTVHALTDQCRDRHDPDPLATVARFVSAEILSVLPDWTTRHRLCLEALHSGRPDAMDSLSHRLFGIPVSDLRQTSRWMGGAIAGMHPECDALSLLYGPVWFRSPLHGLVPPAQGPVDSFAGTVRSILSKRLAMLESSVARSDAGSRV